MNVPQMRYAICSDCVALYETLDGMPRATFAIYTNESEVVARGWQRDPNHNERWLCPRHAQRRLARLERAR
jgi:hypothetical protein